MRQEGEICNTDNPTMSISNATDKDRVGMRLFLKRCLCEIKSYKPLTANKNLSYNGVEREKKYFCGISVIVCTYNRPEKLKNTLMSITNQSLRSELYEVIVVNNGDELPSEIQNICKSNKNFKIITEKRIGLSYARNKGATIAKGRYLFYIDDDAEADRLLLEKVFQDFRKYKDVGIIGGQIILKTPDPKPDVVLSGKEALWSEYTVQYKKYREITKQYEFPFGANFSVNHHVFDQIGGFDEGYGRKGHDYAGGEETAMCFKVLNSGYKIGIEPGAVVYHYVDEDRFSRAHIRETIKAGIFTTYRLYKEGYSSSIWDRKYLIERMKIAEKEVEKLRACGTELELYYKECERNGFLELVEKIETEDRLEA